MSTEEELNAYVKEHQDLFDKMNALFDGKPTHMVVEVCLQVICIAAAERKAPAEEFADYVKVRYEQMLALTKTLVTDAASA